MDSPSNAALPSFRMLVRMPQLIFHKFVSPVYLFQKHASVLSMIQNTFHINCTPELLTAHHYQNVFQNAHSNQLWAATTDHDFAALVKRNTFSYVSISPFHNLFQSNVHFALNKLKIRKQISCRNRDIF